MDGAIQGGGPRVFAPLSQLVPVYETE